MTNELAVFRHGDTKYLHPYARDQSLEDANDLTEKWIQHVREETAEFLADGLWNRDKVVIWTSSMPRAMHTAKIIKEEIKNSEQWKNLEIRIKAFDLFQDIINFEPYKNLFVALIKWWKYTENWQTYKFDKKITNPDNLSAAEYYFRDDIYKIDLNWNNYPPSLWEYLKTVEPNKDILKRLIRFLKKIKRLGENNYKIILVSHWSFIYPLHRFVWNMDVLGKWDFIELYWDSNWFYLKWDSEKKEILQILEEYSKKTV